jgi:hypothetical protein
VQTHSSPHAPAPTLTAAIGTYNGAPALTVTGTGWDVTLGAASLVWVGPTGSSVFDGGIGVNGNGTLDTNFVPIPGSGTYTATVAQPTDKHNPKLSASAFVTTP